MPALYLSEQYSIVHKDGETLVVSPKRNGDGPAAGKKRVPLIKIDHVVVEGEVTLTTSALHTLLERGVEVSFLGVHGDFKGSLSPGFSKNSVLRIAQHQAHNDAERRLHLARRFVTGKLANMRTLLMRYNRKEAQTALDDPIRAIEQALKAVPRAKSLDSLIGHEGAGSAAYFSGFGHLLEHGMGFRGRVRRPPRDPVNALLSYGYAILTSKLSSLTHAVGLDPYVGYLHSSQYGRPALALDILEEFRPVVVDSVVLSLINTRALQEKDFLEEMGSVRLANEPRRTFLAKFEERLNTEITHPTFGYKAPYRRCLELQARVLAKTLLSEIPEYQPFKVR